MVLVDSSCWDVMSMPSGCTGNAPLHRKIAADNQIPCHAETSIDDEGGCVGVRGVGEVGGVERRSGDVLPKPAPPATTSAPVSVLVESVTSLIAYEPSTWRFCPMPTPPATVSAPVACCRSR